MKTSSTKKKLNFSILIIIVLSLCLVVTTFALVYAIVSIDSHVFRTGTVQINLNGGQSVINDSDLLFEPGMTVKRDFFIQNTGTGSVYYKLYFQNVSGGLADVLQISICDGDKLLYEGTPASLTRSAVQAADDVLDVGESRSLQIYFHFPEGAGNDTQNQYLSFDFAADAVQTKNNPDKTFD